MGKYRKMIECAKQKGLTTDEKMWKSIASVEELLDEIEDETLSNRFLRRQHEIMYGHHFDEQTALMEVERIHYTDKDGVHHSGAHWSVNDVENAMRAMNFQSSVTRWDKYVAANAMYADACKVLGEEQILRVAHSFYFCDEDWVNKDSKVWDYFSAKDWFETREID